MGIFTSLGAFRCVYAFKGIHPATVIYSACV